MKKDFFCLPTLTGLPVICDPSELPQKRSKQSQAWKKTHAVLHAYSRSVYLSDVAQVHREMEPKP
jgi:hypothetical protein